MQMTFRSRSGRKISERLKTYTTRKLNKLETFFSQISHVEIEFSEEKNPRITKKEVVEVTLHSRGHILRAKESSTTMNSAVDLVFEKLEKQVKKYKDKMYASNQRTASKSEVAAIEREASSIVKTKNFELRPMSTEEAVSQMEMLGHNFFVFANANTDEINVIYRRKDKKIGLIQPVQGA